MECDRESLTENEYAKIEEIQPEYNRMMCPPSPDRMWPRKENFHEKCCYVQYHNFDALQYLPHENSLVLNEYEPSFCINTKKRDCLKLKGLNIYLIVGLKQKSQKKKDYFLWECIQIEEISLVELKNGIEYSLKGTCFFCKAPIYLNDLPGFEHFAKHTMGSFAYGMQNAINDPFSKYIINESNFIRSNQIKNKLLWLANFEDRLNDTTFCLTKKVDRKIELNCFQYCDEIILCNEVHIGFIFKERYNNLFLCNPDFIIDQFRPLQKQHPNAREIFFTPNTNISKFAEAFPDISCIIPYCGEIEEPWNDVVKEFKKHKNIELRSLD